MGKQVGLGGEEQDSVVMGNPGPEQRRRVQRRRAISQSRPASAIIGMSVIAGLLALTIPRDAKACGACYSASSESTIVSNHQMAFSISKQRTILWDQIEYSGNPKEFAYVLPAKPGTRLEPSSDAWFASLEASTRPIIMAPQRLQPQGGGYSSGGYSGGGGGYGGESGGCCSLASEDSAGSYAEGASYSDASAGSSSPPLPPPVQVVERAVVGPYETVTVRSTDSDALQKWLVDHGFAIPEISAPIIASYVQNGFDFIALRLRPGGNERAIQPIRIVSPGVDLTLPLRLMQIGAGAQVGITLYVISEGRYRTKNFPEGPVDFDKLIWDNSQARSNYQELLTRAMATGEGRAFVTEYAQKPDFSEYAAAQTSGVMGNPPLAAAYKQSCIRTGPEEPYIPYSPPDAGSESDASSDDAGEDASTLLADAGDDAAAIDAGGDASSGQSQTDAGSTTQVRLSKCDDLKAAIDGLAQNDVWITRLRANLPNAALADTLILEPTPKQEVLDNVHQTKDTGTISASIAARHLRNQQGTFALMGLTAFVVSRFIRRRKKA